MTILEPGIFAILVLDIANLIVVQLTAELLFEVRLDV